MTVATNVPTFCQGIQHFTDNLPGFEQYGQTAAISAGQRAIASRKSHNPVFCLTFTLD
jgi:hypothetical protein